MSMKFEFEFDALYVEGANQDRTSRLLIAG
jgi:hypothetical protein